MTPTARTYWCGAPPALLALRDVRRAGCNSPAVRAAMVRLVGTQGEGTGRCWARTERGVWREGEEESLILKHSHSGEICVDFNLMEWYFFFLFVFQLTTVFAAVKDAGSAAAPGKERQRWCHQPVDNAALPWSQCNATSCREVGKRWTSVHLHY